MTTRLYKILWVQMSYISVSTEDNCHGWWLHSEWAGKGTNNPHWVILPLVASTLLFMFLFQVRQVREHTLWSLLWLQSVSHRSCYSLSLLISSCLVLSCLVLSCRPTMIKYGINNIRELVGHKVNLQMVYDGPICRLDSWVSPNHNYY